MTGRPRSAVDGLPAYRPGKGAAQAEAEHGIADAIKLASNENPWGPVPSVVAAIEAAAGEVNRYADHRATALRERLADRLAVDPTSVTVGCGSVGLLQQLFLTYVDPGDEVVFPWRSFEVYPVYAALTGGIAVMPPLAGDRFDLGAVADAVTERTKLVLLATPNNPTGTSVSTDDVGDLVAHIDNRTLVVIDEAYREFNAPSFGDPVVDLVPRFDNVMVLRTFSKAHGLAGLRVGYGVASPTVVESVDKTLFPFAVNGVAQAAAVAAIDADQEIRARVAALLAERDRVVAALRAAGHVFPDPQANLVWLRLGDRTDGVYLALERRGVGTRPFSGEGLRVTIGTPAENDRFVDALAAVTAD